MIDGTQSVGAMPIDVEKINPDFLVVSGYKWLLGPYNLGLCYINPKYHNGDPLEYWWGHKDGAENPTSLINYPSDYLPGARRFDYGHKGNFHLLPPLIKSLEQLLDWGVDEIYKYTSEVNNKIFLFLMLLTVITSPRKNFPLISKIPAGKRLLFA